MIGWLLRDRTTGRIVVAQPPNVPILVATSFALAGRVAAVVGRSSRPCDGVATAALTVWAGDELLRGVNPLRRMIGASTLVGIVMTLRRAGRERAHRR